MGKHNPIHADGIYFLTPTVVDWVDVFTRPVYKHIIIEALRFCQQEKGLDLYAWVIMSNHLHLIASAKEGYHLSNILRDFKKFTSKKIVEAIATEAESRQRWMLYRFEYNGKYDSRITHSKFWQEGNEAIELLTADFAKQKLDYLHNNPVRAEIVQFPEHYIYSSAIDYAGGKGLLDVILL